MKKEKDRDRERHKERSDVKERRLECVEKI
jgi:hypothetical protein